MPIFVYITLAAYAVWALLLLRRLGLASGRGRNILALCLILASLSVRLLLLPHETLDYIDFLKPWTEFFADNGGFAALGESVGNYNPPYLYILAAISYLGCEPLLPIKLVSIFFDMLLACAAAGCVLKVSSSEKSGFVCFFAVLFLPTVLLNGAYWGQCDSIYAFFGVWALWLSMQDRGVGAMLALSASLAFKLQAVFIIPAFFVLLLRRRLRLGQLLLFPAAYVVWLLPPVLCGRSFVEVMTLYLGQTGSIGGGLNYNSASVFSMLGWGQSLDTELWSRLGIIAAFAFMLLVLVTAVLRRRELDDMLTLGFALLLCIGIPFLLPHMHDRYFYLADILSLCLACALPAFALPAALVQFGSMHGYLAYLTLRYITHPRFAGASMLLALCCALVFVCCYGKDRYVKKVKNGA